MISTGVPKDPSEVITLEHTLQRRSHLLDRSGTTNGPTEAVNDRLEHLRGSTLSFRSLNNYIARSLLQAWRLRTTATPSIAGADVDEQHLFNSGPSQILGSAFSRA